MTDDSESPPDGERDGSLSTDQDATRTTANEDDAETPGSTPFSDHIDALPDNRADGPARDPSGADPAETESSATGTDDLPRVRDDRPESTHETQSAGTDRQGPLSDIASAVDERANDAAGDDGDAFDDLFERETVGEIDSEQLWDRLENDQPPDSFLEDDREIRDIDKRSYCHQCPHFAEPPALECRHDGTDILAVTALESFRVADCPVVLENEALERER